MRDLFKFVSYVQLQNKTRLGAAKKVMLFIQKISQKLGAEMNAWELL